MTNVDAARQRSEFLARLDAAMHDVPHGVATEIRAGIVEELEGLDAAATSVRIEQLGDPAVIAREAGAASGVDAVTVAASEKRPLAQSRGFAITAAFVLAFGGFVVPIIGWFVGVVMVCVSTLWHRWEKVIAIALPFVAAALVAVIVTLISPSAPGDSGARNPLLPTSYDLWHSGVLFVFLLIPVSGLWLLWRLRRR